MYRKDKAIFLHQLRHSDSGYVVHVFCKELGFVSGVYRKSSKKHVSFLQPFSVLDVNISDRENKDLQTFKEVSRAWISESIDSDIRKSTVSIFLTEVLFRTLQKGYRNEKLFEFIRNAIFKFDKLEFQVNFHLWFLKELLRFYGLSPHIGTQNGNVFDLETGEISSSAKSGMFVKGEVVEKLVQFLGMNFEESMVFSLRRLERKDLMDLMLQYLELHNSGLKKLNSREILEIVFS